MFALFLVSTVILVCVNTELHGSQSVGEIPHPRFVRQVRCKSLSDCPSGFDKCEENRCRINVVNNGCKSNSDCASSKECIGGICIEKAIKAQYCGNHNCGNQVFIGGRTYTIENKP